MRAKKQLKSFINSLAYNDEYFSRASITSIVRAILEPVINQNVTSILFSRIKNKDGLDGLVKRLEYCTNVEMVDTTVPSVLIKDDYIELEFIIFNSPRYNFALVWDYSSDNSKNYSKLFFTVNSRVVNDLFEILQANVYTNYREKFYQYKPERRDNELMNEAVFNLLKRLNTTSEEGIYGGADDFIVDLSDEFTDEDKIKEIRHEIKNQLSILDVYTALIEKEFGKSKKTDVIKKSLSLITLSVNELGNFDEDEIREIDIYDVINDCIFMNEEVLSVNNNKLKFESDHKYEIKVFADEIKLLSVLNNVIKNANESTASDTITIKLDIEKTDAVIRIVNHGDMIDENSIKRIFEKGFSTKKRGSGIGLHFCKKYIESVNGKIELEKSDTEATIFKITIPVN